MFLQYGNLILAVNDLNRFERTNVYTEDGTDLLYVRVVLGITAAYSPGGVPQLTSVTALTTDTAASLAGDDDTAGNLSATLGRDSDPTGSNFLTGGPPDLETDSPPGPTPIGSQFNGAQTDAELKFRLLYPRQQLILWAFDRQTGDDIQWLTSPRPGFLVDCKNGPRPISCDVVTAEGEGTIGVFYQIETHIQPCPQGSDRLVLSHRWRMRHQHDEDNYLTRVIQGRIVFNSEALSLLGVSPDWFRNQFLHPIPLGMQRNVPDITLSEDGLTLDYTITDTDPTIIFEPADSGASRIDISERFELVLPVEDLLGLGASIKNRRQAYWHAAGRRLHPRGPGAHGGLGVD